MHTYLSISRVDVNQKHDVLLHKIFEETDGEFVIDDSNENSFTLEGSTYAVTGRFALFNKKGSLQIKRDGKPLAELFLSADPTFIMLVKVSKEDWIELNVSIDT